MFNVRYKRRGLSTTHLVLIVVGILAAAMIAIGMGVTLFLAVAQAREQATMIKAGMQLQQLEKARIIYAQQFQPEQRPSQVTIQELIDEQFITAELVQSPYGPVSDGRGDFWLNPRLTVDELANATSDNRMIAAYDRAMYESANKVNLAYSTGEFVLMIREEFDRLITESPNADVDFDLPGSR